MKQDAKILTAVYTLVTAAITRTVALNRLLDNFEDIGHGKIQIFFQRRRKISESEYSNVVNFRKIIQKCFLYAKPKQAKYYTF